MGTAFAEGSYQPAAPGPLRWREPAPTATGAGGVTASFDNNLLTARVRSTVADEVALRLVVRTVHRQLVELTRLVPALQFFLEQVGDDLLLAVRATPQPAGTNWPAVQAAVLEALETSATFLDVIIAETIADERTPEAVAAELDPRHQVTAAIRSGRRREPAEVVDGLAALTVEQVQATVDQVRAAALLSIGSGQVVPDGGRLWQPPLLPPVTRPTVNRRSRVRLPLGPRPVRQELRASPTVLEQTLRIGGHGQRAESVRTAVDLTAVVARLDTSTTWTTLVDREDRRLVLAWPAYRRVRPLRALVDAAAPPPLRTTGSVPPVYTARLRSGLRRRLALRLTPLLVVLLLVALPVAIVMTKEALTDYQEPVIATVPLGAEITLANGSTVRVDHPRWRKVPGYAERVRLVDVRYCGGGVTVDRNTSERARNYVTGERFGGVGVTSVSRYVLTLRPGETPLLDGNLEQGQCLTGTLGFTDEPVPPGGRRITYHNGSGDQLAWTLD